MPSASGSSTSCAVPLTETYRACSPSSMTIPATTGRSLMSRAFSESVPVLKSSPSVVSDEPDGHNDGRAIRTHRRQREEGARGIGEQVLEPGGDVHEDPQPNAPAGESLVGLDVLGAGLLDDVVGQRRRRLAGVPIPPGRRRGQPVADVLLVERRLRVAGLPRRRPARSATSRA